MRTRTTSRPLALSLAVVGAIAVVGGVTVPVAPAEAAVSTAPIASWDTPGGPYTYVVPDGVSTIHVEAVGGSAGDAYSGSYLAARGGAGAFVSGDIEVTGGQTLLVNVGGSTPDYDFASNVVQPGGVGGGGAGGTQYAGGSGGGGASDVRQTPDLSTRLLVAGGGGGAFYHDGGDAGEDGSPASNQCDTATAATAGTATAGGIGGTCQNEDQYRGADGTFGQGGAGGVAGGGGGGWYGGGGGGGLGGGAGGSSYTAPEVARPSVTSGARVAPSVKFFADIPVTSVTVKTRADRIPASTGRTLVTATITTAGNASIRDVPLTFSSALGNRFGVVSHPTPTTYEAVMYASDAAGTDTVTATVDDLGRARTGSTTTSQYGDPTDVRVAEAPAVITADGNAKSVVTATVTDAAGQGVPGETVAFDTTDPRQSLSPVADNGDGTYTVTVTSSTAAGTSTVRATLGSLIGSTSVTQTPGAPAHVAVDLSTDRLVADGTGTSIVTVRITDGNDNAIVGADTSITSSAQDDSVSGLTDNGDGTYTTTIAAGTTAGTSLITVKAGAATGTATLTKTAGAPAALELRASSDSLPADGQAISTVAATVQDAFGNGVAGVTPQLTSTGVAATIGALTDNGDGTYSATITAGTALGRTVITASLGTLTSSTTIVQVPLGDLTAAKPVVSGSATVGSTLTVSTGTWGPAPVDLSVQWLRDGKAITGATSTTYRITVSSIGHRISAQVSGTKSGFEPVTVTSAGKAVKGTLTGFARPTISGTPVVGKRLAAVRGDWGPGEVRYSYKWYRNGIAISGATSRLYTPIEADRGAKVKVAITGSKPDYTSVRKVSATVTVR